MTQRDAADRILTHVVNVAKEAFESPADLGRLLRAAQVVRQGLVRQDGDEWYVHPSHLALEYQQSPQCPCKDRAYHPHCKHSLAVQLAKRVLDAEQTVHYAQRADSDEYGLVWVSTCTQEAQQIVFLAEGAGRGETVSIHDIVICGRPED